MKTSDTLLRKELRQRLRLAEAGKVQVLACSAAKEAEFLGLLEQVLAELPGFERWDTDLLAGSYRHPWAPFLDLVAAKMPEGGDAAWEAQLEQAGVYTFHRALFKSLLGKGKAERTEEIFLFEAEIEYEIDQMRKNLLGLLCSLQRGPVVLVVRKLQAASAATLGLLAWLVAQEQPGRLLVLTHHSPQAAQAQSRQFDSLAAFLFAAEQQGCVLAIPTEPDDEPVLEPPLAPAAPGIAELVAQASQHYHFLAFEDALLELGVGYAVELTPDDGLRIHYHYLRGMVLSGLWRWPEARDELSLAFALAGKASDLGFKSEIGRALAFAHFQLDDREQAGQLLLQCVRLARGVGSPSQLARVLVFERYINESLYPPRHILEEYENLVDLLAEQGYHNSVSIMHSLAAHVRAVLDIRGWEEAAARCQAVIEASRASQNAYRLSVAHHSLGLVYELTRQRSAALEEYRRALAIRQELGNVIELTKINNGLGFFCFLGGEFATALDYFERGLALLKRQRNYEELCLSLANVAAVYFCAYDYEHALQFYDHLLKIMDGLQISVLPWHTRQGLYALTGICCIRLGRYMRALDLYRKAQAAASHAEETGAYLILELLIAYEAGDAQPISLKYARALKIVRKEHAPFLAWQLVLDARRLLVPISDPAEITEYLLNGQKQCREQDQSVYARLFAQALETGSCDPGSMEELRLKPVAFDADHILELARKDLDIHQLHRKVNEIAFLNQLNSVILHHGDAHFVERFMRLISAQLMADLYLFIARDQTADPQIVYRSGELAESREFLLDLAPLFRSRIPVHLSPGDRGLPAGYHSLALLPLTVGQHINEWLLLASSEPVKALDEEALRLLGVVAKQLAVAYELKRATEQLHQAATIDGLTGLYNRQEILRRITAERSRLLRYKTGLAKRFSLIFIDLDNFKQYNDSYGHAVGDFLLRQFAQLFAQSIRDLDAIGRYGGDEFLILLPETDQAGALVVAERIQARIGQAGQFREQISLTFRLSVDLPAEKTIGCSMGIACFDAERSTEIGEFVARADHALYQAKKQGKGRICLAGSQ